MTVRAEELQEWHIKALRPRYIYDTEPIDLLGLLGDDRIFASAIVKDEMVLAIVGGNIQWSGVAHCWAIISDSVQLCPKSFHKCIRNLIETSFKGVDLHRLEATVRSDFDMGQKWLISLGFEFEGVLRYYGADRSDYKLFARYA